MQLLCGHVLLSSDVSKCTNLLILLILEKEVLGNCIVTWVYCDTPHQHINIVIPILHLWNAEKQSSWPTRGCFPRLDFPPPPPTTSRWEDFGYSQTSTTTSRWLLADSHLVGSGWISQWYPEFQLVAGTCLQYTSTLLQLRLLLPECHVNLVHLWRFGNKNT